MRGSFLAYIRPLVVTLLLLIMCEVLSSAFLPLIGLNHYRIPFNVLIVLYFGFKLDSPYTPIIIFCIQYFHSFFSIEGWEMGTIAGIIICISMSYLKDLIHFKSSIATIFVTQVFQFVWFVITSSLIYLKHENINYIIDKFWRFLPESIVLSLLSPFLFLIIGTIWSSRSGSLLGEDS